MRGSVAHIFNLHVKVPGLLNWPFSLCIHFLKEKECVHVVACICSLFMRTSTIFFVLHSVAFRSNQSNISSFLLLKVTALNTAAPEVLTCIFLMETHKYRLKCREIAKRTHQPTIRNTWRSVEADRSLPDVKGGKGLCNCWSKKDQEREE